MNKNMNKSQPLVSVVMPVYNAGDFLVEAIESILNQTYQNFEFIIVDDNSTDGSNRIIKRYQKRYPKKIKLIQMTKTLNCGGDRCANEGIKLATGKYIARMDADDIAHKDRLTRQVSFLEKNPKVFLLGSTAYVVDKNATLIGEKKEPLSYTDIYRSYCTFHPLIHPSVMLRRIYRGKPFAYEIRYSANNDYYTFFKILCRGACFANLPDKLLYYRIHGRNDTFVNIKEKFLNTLKIRMLMVLKYGYRPTPKDIATSVVQSITLLLLPEFLTAKLYLLTKGIIKIKNPLWRLKLRSPYKLLYTLR